MRLALQCLLGAALLCAVSASLPTVPTLNLNQYLGHWYQVYSNPLVDTFIEGTVCLLLHVNCECDRL